MNEPRFPSLRKRVKLRATPDEVWAALSTAEGLVRWLPLQAQVTPGVGGSLSFSWDGEHEGTASIVVWEPGQRLVSERRLELPSGEVRVTEDWKLEARGGAVHLHLEQSGFPQDEAGRAWAEASSRGWDFELRGLRHALERHAGTPREVLSFRRSVDQTTDEAWSSLLGEAGLGGADLPTLRHGDRYQLRPTEGPPLSGCLQLLSPPQDLAATVEEIGDAYLRLRLDPPGFGVPKTQVQLWLSTFGVSGEEREEWRGRLERILSALFPVSE